MSAQPPMPPERPERTFAMPWPRHSAEVEPCVPSSTRPSTSWSVSRLSMRPTAAIVHAYGKMVESSASGSALSEARSRGTFREERERSPTLRPSRARRSGQRRAARNVSGPARSASVVAGSAAADSAVAAPIAEAHGDRGRQHPGSALMRRTGGPSAPHREPARAGRRARRGIAEVRELSARGRGGDSRPRGDIARAERRESVGAASAARAPRSPARGGDGEAVGKPSMTGCARADEAAALSWPTHLHEPRSSTAAAVLLAVAPPARPSAPPTSPPLPPPRRRARPRARPRRPSRPSSTADERRDAATTRLTCRARRGGGGGDARRKNERERNRARLRGACSRKPQEAPARATGA